MAERGRGEIRGRKTGHRRGSVKQSEGLWHAEMSGGGRRISQISRKVEVQEKGRWCHYPHPTSPLEPWQAANMFQVVFPKSCHSPATLSVTGCLEKQQGWSERELSSGWFPLDLHLVTLMDLDRDTGGCWWELNPPQGKSRECRAGEGKRGLLHCSL